MNSSKKHILLCIAAAIIAGVALAGIFIYNSPEYYTDLMLRMGRYSSVVKYYNDHDINESDRESVDSKLYNTIEDAFEKWESYTYSYEKAGSVIQPFLVIKDDTIKELAQSHYSFMEIENTGNKVLAEAESDFADNDYLKAMKCLDKVDSSFSSYRSLEDIYNESRELLIKEIGNPRTEEEYKEALKKLDGYLLEIDDDVLEAKRMDLESELTEYSDVHEIIENATESFENKKYGESFKTLEKGAEKYPNSNKIKYALSAYQYAYILSISGNVEILMEEKDYEGAVKVLEEAIGNYDCDQFEELLDSVKRKDSVLYNIGASLSDAGDYVFTSAKKLVLGDFDKDEEETLLSLGGSIAASIAGVDIPLDARDLAYDLSHWGEGDYFAARLALDAVGVIPVIGALKYLKHVDTIADVADTAHDVVNTVDAVHDATNIGDTIHDAANAADAAHDVVNAAESAEDITKQIDDIVEDVVTDVSKKADIVPDLADDFTDAAKAADKVEDAADVAQTVTKKGGSYGEVFKNGEGDLFEVHHMPADSASPLHRNDGPAIKMDKKDHHLTASWGASADAMKYKQTQKELIENGHFLEALQMDIDDIKTKFPDGKYDEAINEMMEYVNKLVKEGVISG